MCFFVAAISWKPYEVQQPKLTSSLGKECSKEIVNLEGNSLYSLFGRNSPPDLWLDVQNGADVSELLVEALTGIYTESSESITHLIKEFLVFL